MKRKIVTVDSIRASITTIRQMAVLRDYEVAHNAEIELHQAVLRAIAKGQCEDPIACARAALRSLDIEFIRVTS